MNRGVLACAVSLLLASATPSSAQTGVTLRGFGDAGVTVFNAAQSFKAILGSAAGPVFGGGVDVGLTRNLFVSVAASRFRRTGQRVFVFQNQVYKLGVSDTISVTPLQVSAGYRFRGRRPSRFVPYAGGGSVGTGSPRAPNTRPMRTMKRLPIPDITCLPDSRLRSADGLPPPLMHSGHRFRTRSASRPPASRISTTSMISAGSR